MPQRGFTIGEDGQRFWVSADDACRLLEQAEFVAIESIPWSSNYTFASRLVAEEQPPFLAVYKPRRGEIPLYDFPDGTLYKRERAAYLTSAALGWDFVPPTIVRDGPHGIGSVQLFVDAEPRADFFEYKANHVAEIQRIALFDVVANNADRKAGHCLKSKDGKIWGIDHGLTFNTVPKLRTVIWDFQDEPIPGPLLRQLRTFRHDHARAAKLRTELEQLLSKPEVAAFFKRVDTTLERGTYPRMSSRRAVPWPWY